MFRIQGFCDLRRRGVQGFGALGCRSSRIWFGGANLKGSALGCSGVCGLLLDVSALSLSFQVSICATLHLFGRGGGWPEEFVLMR